MSKVENIAVVTGGRADFGLLSNLCQILDNDNRVKLTVIATGSHLSNAHGYTLKEVEAFCYTNIETVDLNISGDTREDINVYISTAISKFSVFFSHHQINKILVLGDRYEIFGASIAAAILGIKIAHIHGGEVTEGAFDEFMRHSITKMSSLHFTAHEDYSKRIRRLGEDPKTIFNVGGLGAENIELMKSSLLSRKECEKILNVKLSEKNLFVTFHPETNKSSSLQDLNELLTALSNLQHVSLFISMPNADTNFNEFSDEIKEFVIKKPDCRWAFYSLGHQVYFSLLQFVDAVVGNSSSGLLEAPSFNIATINVGNRQKGRVKGKSVIDVEPCQNLIRTTLEELFEGKFKEITDTSVNPFYKNGTAEEIARIFIESNERSDTKPFYD
jgi:GDP/UDP-N,N'-diacetylbacillosamine 2-epimerase (hydrolysing)